MLIHFCPFLPYLSPVTFFLNYCALSCWNLLVTGFLAIKAIESTIVLLLKHLVGAWKCQAVRTSGEFISSRFGMVSFQLLWFPCSSCGHSAKQSQCVCLSSFRWSWCKLTCICSFRSCSIAAGGNGEVGSPSCWLCKTQHCLWEGQGQHSADASWLPQLLGELL